MSILTTKSISTGCVSILSVSTVDRSVISICQCHLLIKWGQYTSQHQRLTGWVATLVNINCGQVEWSKWPTSTVDRLNGQTDQHQLWTGWMVKLTNINCGQVEWSNWPTSTVDRLVFLTYQCFNCGQVEDGLLYLPGHSPSYTSDQTINP